MFFPWRNYKDEELYYEFERLKRKVDGSTKCLYPLSFSTIGFKCTNRFFQYERMNTSGIGRPTTIQYWEKNSVNVIKFSERMGRDLFSTLNYFNHSPSQFPIVTACLVYKYFKATKVLDPYAGWGDRCLAAIANDISYIGIDSNEALKQPYDDLIKFYNSSKTTIIIDKCENVDIENLDFDLVFTSPPFWTKGKMIERYRNVEVSRDDFMNNSLIPIFKKCGGVAKGTLSRARICLYIPDDMYNDLQKLYGPSNIILEFKITNSKIGKIYCWN
jgi:16S rRNA G966 N2-methylase RsmD